MISLIFFVSSIVALCNSSHENRLSYLHHFGHFLLDEINRITHSIANNLDDSSLDHSTVEPIFGPHCGPDGSDLISKMSARIIPDEWNFHFRHHSYSISFSAACRSHDLCLAAEPGLDSDIFVMNDFELSFRLPVTPCNTLCVSTASDSHLPTIPPLPHGLEFVTLKHILNFFLILFSIS